ncbi:unnamed protein product [Rhizophagus irregularis]|nr:unnamed protein product [Rhizophagus irregularis]
MPPTSTVTVFSHAQEFSEDFFADNGKLMCRFCDHSINFQTKNTITAHIGSKTHIRNKNEKKEQQIKKRQPTIQTILNASEIKKTAVNNLVDAFVTADIPLEKIDKLQNWLCENCNEGGFIPKSDTLHRDYLPKLFEDHVNQLKEYFRGRQVSIIIDETTDTHILNLIGETWVSINYFQVVHQLLANIKQTFVYSRSRKVRYISYIQRQGVSNPKNIPLSNTTRWNTWFHKFSFHRPTNQWAY